MSKELRRLRRLMKDAKVLVNTDTFMAITNAKKVSKWKQLPDGSYVYDGVVEL